ncbi:uncharacterized protein N7498_006826 [Penicillium cinerascens]|uniref:DDE-1 domain-containing protein n=1 Tax=Penicillium cinerascens TaxID=70096 RepID=A0A9W9MDE8_9EURO|nr:uncharacterized protein N7498_006826 [Penicillium cinerascens]KAJ5197709.1 hypothetical protein N7498_006826 [Penicillium cinerascens]
MDETCFQLGVATSTRGPSQYVQDERFGSKDKGETVTVVECASATGEGLPAYVIFPGVVFMESRYRDGAPDDYRVNISQSGYINGEIALDSLQNHFDKHTKAKANGSPIPATLPKGERSVSRFINKLAKKEAKGSITLLESSFLEGVHLMYRGYWQQATENGLNRHTVSTRLSGTARPKPNKRQLSKSLGPHGPCDAKSSIKERKTREERRAAARRQREVSQSQPILGLEHPPPVRSTSQIGSPRPQVSEEERREIDKRLHGVDYYK